MRKEERARHANTSASSFQPKQNLQKTDLRGRRQGKKPGPQRGRVWAGAQGWSLWNLQGLGSPARDWSWHGGWGLGINHQCLPSSVPTGAGAQGGR